YAVPKQLESLLNAADWAHQGLLASTHVFNAQAQGEEAEELDSVQQEIVDAVVVMSNHVMVNSGSKTLMRLRTSHPHYFRLVPLYCRVMQLLGTYRYRLSTRRFIYDVFDVNLATLHGESVEAAGNDDVVTEDAVGDGESSTDMMTSTSRRFSSSSQHMLADGATQRKRASTLQGLSTETVFSRRPTNGLDQIRPGRAASQTNVAVRVPPTPVTYNDAN
ncbi:hypothetical protein GGH97_005699, partial [Coemansia sp. RSA 475]